MKTRHPYVSAREQNLGRRTRTQRMVEVVAREHLTGHHHVEPCPRHREVDRVRRLRQAMPSLTEVPDVRAVEIDPRRGDASADPRERRWRLRRRLPEVHAARRPQRTRALQLGHRDAMSGDEADGDPASVDPSRDPLHDGPPRQTESSTSGRPPRPRIHPAPSSRSRQRCLRSQRAPCSLCAHCSAANANTRHAQSSTPRAVSGALPNDTRPRLSSR